MSYTTWQIRHGPILGIRHKLLRPQKPPWAFQQLGRPVRISAIPPSMGHPGLWFRTTSQVYLFGISPIVAPRELQDRHFYLLGWSLLNVIRHSSFIFSCIWMGDLVFPPVFKSPSAMDSGLCNVVYVWRDSWDLLDLTTKVAVNFST
jgi:hypothetical protein